VEDISKNFSKIKQLLFMANVSFYLKGLWMMDIKCFIFCLLTYTCLGQPQTSLDDLIADVFKKDPTSNNPPTQTTVTQPSSAVDDLIADIFKTDSSAFSSTTQATVTEPKYESCGDQKECVPRWLCANDTINTSGENIIDIRINTDSPTDSSTKTCSNYLHRCCSLPDKVKVHLLTDNIRLY